MFFISHTTGPLAFGGNYDNEVSEDMISDQHSATGTLHSRLQTPGVYYMSTMNVPSLRTQPVI